MAGPLIGGRRPISWRLAIVVSFVAAYATARWLEGIFGVGSISGTVSFFVLVELADDDRATIYGALLEMVGRARGDDAGDDAGDTLALWKRRGKRAFEAESEGTEKGDGAPGY